MNLGDEVIVSLDSKGHEVRGCIFDIFHDQYGILMKYGQTMNVFGEDKMKLTGYHYDELDDLIDAINSRSK